MEPGGEVLRDAVVDGDVEVAEEGGEVVAAAGGHVDQGRHARALQQVTVRRVVDVAQVQVRQDFNRLLLCHKQIKRLIMICFFLIF